jgi:5-methyltetrahydrofolate--homocysteine methyltransferase
MKMEKSMTVNPRSPTLGAQIIPSIALDDLLPYLNHKALYRISWGASKASGARWEEIQRSYEKRLEDMLQALRSDPWLQPRAGYGHWYGASEGNSILVFQPEHPDEIAARFELPRQAQGEKLCLADYLPSRSSDNPTLLSFQVVTVGKQASERINALFAKGDYAEGYFAHGLAVQFAEATADFIHQRIRNEVGLKKNQGRRYSWGYEPIPDLAQHTILFELIPARQKLGMDLTSAYQLIPEQSTAAMVVHHKAARYFHID